jgi:hypothetical protein
MLPASVRRLSRLAAFSLVLAGALGGCIAGETIAASSSATIPGRYVLDMFSGDAGLRELPLRMGSTTDSIPRPIYLRYATIDMYDDGTFVEVYELDVMDVAGLEVEETRWDVGNGTWTSSGRDIEFKAVIRPGLLKEWSAWSGYLGDGGSYAFNLRRSDEPPMGMHYRRY